MYLRKANPLEIYAVAYDMRPRDFEEISCVTWFDNRDDLARDLMLRYSAHENVYCFGDDVPIGIISYIPVRPGVWSLGMFATDKFQKVSSFLTKRVIRDIIPALDNANAHRVEAQSLAGYDEVHKWLDFIGLKKEGELKGFGSRGQDFVTFAYVRSPGQKPGTVMWRRPGVVE